MPKYNVTVRATICKAFTVSAKSKAEAEAKANELFNPGDTSDPTYYDQQVTSVNRIKKEGE